MAILIEYYSLTFNPSLGQQPTSMVYHSAAIMWLYLTMCSWAGDLTDYQSELYVAFEWCWKLTLNFYVLEQPTTQEAAVVVFRVRQSTLKREHRMNW